MNANRRETDSRFLNRHLLKIKIKPIIYQVRIKDNHDFQIIEIITILKLDKAHPHRFSNGLKAESILKNTFLSIKHNFLTQMNTISKWRHALESMHRIKECKLKKSKINSLYANKLGEFDLNQSLKTNKSFRFRVEGFPYKKDGW